MTPVRTFVLVPGAGGSAWYWHCVVPLLEAAGHRVIPAELPAADDSATLGDYAAAIERAAEGSSSIVMADVGDRGGPVLVMPFSFADEQGLVQTKRGHVPDAGRVLDQRRPNTFLKSHAWDEYAMRHLGLKVGAADETKNRFAFGCGTFIACTAPA